MKTNWVDFEKKTHSDVAFDSESNGCYFSSLTLPGDEIKYHSKKSVQNEVTSYRRQRFFQIFYNFFCHQVALNSWNNVLIYDHNFQSLPKTTSDCSEWFFSKKKQSFHSTSLNKIFLRSTWNYSRLVEWKKTVKGDFFSKTIRI